MSVYQRLSFSASVFVFCGICFFCCIEPATASEHKAFLYVLLGNVDDRGEMVEGDWKESLIVDRKESPDGRERVRVDAAAAENGMADSPIHLIAVATGVDKITLYWNGIAGASGYNIYRSTISGGRRTLVAANVAKLDHGPGVKNMYMYTNAKLKTGVEYYFVVIATKSGVKGARSQEEAAVPDKSAVPWDTGDPKTIIGAISAGFEADAAPNVDERTGKTYPTEAGFVTATGPDGVIYEGDSAQGTAAAYAPSSNSGEPGEIMNRTAVAGNSSVSGKSRRSRRHNGNRRIRKSR